MNMIQHWLAHIRTDRVVAFPRDYGLYRRKLLTQKQYLTSCEHAHKNKLEMYTAVLSDYEINNQLVTALFYDIDVDHIDVRKLIKSLNTDTLKSLIHEYENSSRLQSNLREGRNMESTIVVSDASEDVRKAYVDGRCDTSANKGSGLRDAGRCTVSGVCLAKTSEEVKSVVQYLSKDIQSNQSIIHDTTRLYNTYQVDVVELIVQLEPVISVVRALYSGRRGVHLHVDLEPVRVVDLRRAAVYVAELLGIADMVDKQTLGDWRRVSRVPGSYHKLTGSMCVLLNTKTDTELSHLLSTLLAEKFAVKSQCYTVPIPSETREVVSVSGEPPPCISYIVGQLLSGQNITHAARLHLGAYLIRVGLNPVEAAALYRRVPDFNESTTLYQLQWIQKHNYKMYSCVKARQFGLCPLPLENCKYYPSPNWWF